MTSPLGQQMEYQFRLHDRAGRKFLTDLREQLRVEHEPTYQHCLRVGDLARRFALYLGVEKDVAEDFGLAVSCHDIGKLLVPSEILYKTDKLTRAERGIVKAHSSNGERLLEGCSFPLVREAAAIAKHHHETKAAQGQMDIPASVHIASMCDMVDAYTSVRSYRENFTLRFALRTLAEDKRQSFVPEFQRPFLVFMQKVFAQDLAHEAVVLGLQETKQEQQARLRKSCLHGKVRKRHMRVS
ncbi:MAG TPA: hypothetical protein DCW68_00685 [Rhodospirillaceae bacterium]|nr:MAG: hypothetical protein A2018_00920 [Alphaproteobacteria bacterium GWF2_58_20]HAU28617.1 hypothetical protein [Rhodospirillaceae bacterium]